MSTAQDRQQKALATLSRMPIGAAAWVWMTARGPEGQPFFVVVPREKDPEGKSLVKRVRWIAETCPTIATPVKGVMRRLTDSSLVFVTDADLEIAARTVSAAHAVAPDLESIRLVRADGEHFTQSRLVENVAAQARAMTRIAAGEKGWFCLVIDGAQTDLHLDTSAESIKARHSTARSEKPAAKVISGQLRCRDGRVELRPRRRCDGLTGAVIQWSRRNSAWSPLRLLESARAVA